jgi:hypothetical protein
MAEDRRQNPDEIGKCRTKKKMICNDRRNDAPRNGSCFPGIDISGQDEDERKDAKMENQNRRLSLWDSIGDDLQ